MPTPSPIERSLSSVLAFTRTLEQGSFTRAAKSLRLTPAAVSRAVARLEESLGVMLFRRTTRALQPTAEGRSYYAKCSAALALLGEAERDVQRGSEEVRGLVRLSLPITLGLHVILPRLARIREQLPLVELEIHITNQNVDFVQEGVDLAVRMGTLKDATLIARKLGDFTMGVFASKAYLASSGPLKQLEDLATHACMNFVMPRTGRVLPWIFASPNVEVTPASSLRCVEDPRAGVVLAKAGLGLFQTYHFMVQDELASGALVEVLKARGGRTRPFSLIRPRAAVTSKAVRAVAELIVASVETKAPRAARSSR